MTMHFLGLRPKIMSSITLTEQSLIDFGNACTSDPKYFPMIPLSIVRKQRNKIELFRASKLDLPCAQRYPYWEILLLSARNLGS